MRRDGKLVHLGCFATAEEAALCVARSPEGQDEEARQQARAGELTQLVALLVKEEEEEGSAEGSGYNYKLLYSLFEKSHKKGYDTR
mgnify:CR=1 FL=1